MAETRDRLKEGKALSNFLNSFVEMIYLTVMDHENLTAMLGHRQGPRVNWRFDTARKTNLT